MLPMFALPALAEGDDGEDKNGDVKELTNQQRDEVLSVLATIVIRLIKLVPELRSALGETPTTFLNPCFTLPAPETHSACHDTLDHIFKRTEQIG